MVTKTPFFTLRILHNIKLLRRRYENLRHSLYYQQTTYLPTYIATTFLPSFLLASPTRTTHTHWKWKHRPQQQQHDDTITITSSSSSSSSLRPRTPSRPCCPRRPSRRARPCYRSVRKAVPCNTSNNTRTVTPTVFNVSTRMICHYVIRLFFRVLYTHHLHPSFPSDTLNYRRARTEWTRIFTAWVSSLFSSRNVTQTVVST